MLKPIWYLSATGTPCVKIHGINNQNANTVPKYAVEAT